jgi:hypothetical protein
LHVAGLEPSGVLQAQNSMYDADVLAHTGVYAFKQHPANSQLA